MKRKDMAVFLFLVFVCVAGFLYGIMAVKRAEIDAVLIKNSIEGVKEIGIDFKSVVLNGLLSNAFLFILLSVLPASLLGFLACVLVIFCGGFAAGYSCGYLLASLGMSSVLKALFGVLLPSFVTLLCICKMSSLKMCIDNGGMFKKIVAGGVYAAAFALCVAFQSIMQYAVFYKL